MTYKSVRGMRPAVAVLLLATLAACGDDDNDVAAGGPEGQDGMVHVHGLGINPADGDLYVATHYGLWHVGDEGDAERVGPVQDLMGFTVVGDDHFMASGHPGMEMSREGVVNPLGLIESTDGGKTWESISLSGEVDFHALTTANGQIYGWNATGNNVLVSSDGEDWDEGAQGMAMWPLAADPDDPDRVVAIVRTQGRQEGSFEGSTDGGRTWEEFPAVRWMESLSWDADTGLWAADQSGDVYRTSDPEAGDWEQTGSVGSFPIVLLAHDDTLYTATMAPGGTNLILRSTDSGETWDTLYEGL